MALDFVAKEIERLSQEEGLNDREIAEALGCSRSTVARSRKANDIPTACLHNKRDKKYVCGSCGQDVYIRRKDRRKFYCDECELKTDEDLEKKYSGKDLFIDGNVLL